MVSVPLPELNSCICSVKVCPLLIESTTFNPFLGKSIYKGSPPETTTVRHKVFRTTDDFATLGLAMMTGKQHNLDVESILPHKDTVNIIEAHELENFTELGPRRASFVEDLAQTVHSTGARLAELESVKGMVDSIKREIVEDTIGCQ